MASYQVPGQIIFVSKVKKSSFVRVSADSQLRIRRVNFSLGEINTIFGYFLIRFKKDKVSKQFDCF